MADPDWAQFCERACLLGETLVVADLHVGRDATSMVEMPLGERGDLTDRLGSLLDAHAPTEVVVAGDLLHSFSTVPKGVPETVAAVETLVADAGADLVVTPGNHDAMLGEIGDATTADAHRVGETVVCHGHERPPIDAERYVVGHEHPAIEIEGQRRPCFLYGPGVTDGADLLVLPAFSRLAAGSVLNGMATADCLSPLLGDLDACRPVVVTGDGPLPFPSLGELRGFL